MAVVFSMAAAMFLLLPPWKPPPLFIYFFVFQLSTKLPSRAPSLLPGAGIFFSPFPKKLPAVLIKAVR